MRNIPGQGCLLYNASMKRVLIIKLGALGDFVQAFPCFQTIRQEFSTAQITLLTTTPFIALAAAAPWFDHVLTDERPRRTDRAGMKRLRAQLAGYDLVVDLQTSGRSTRYARLADGARWSGLVKSDPFYHANPWRNEMHTLARQADQLRYAGMTPSLSVKLQWLTTHAATHDLPDHYAVLVPGAAVHRPGKKWPIECYAQLACVLAARGTTPVIVGSKAESDLARPILQLCPGAMDLTGQTDLKELGGILHAAAWAIGNDTGPMHLAAAVGTRSVVLFSGESDPKLTAPVGRMPRQVDVLRAHDISDLSLESVVAAIDKSH